jgi:hypothetical protein
MVMYGSAGLPYRSNSVCPASNRISASRTSAAFSRTPWQMPRYRRPGVSGVTGTWREKNVLAASSVGGGNTDRLRPYSWRTCSSARFVVAVDATITGPAGTFPPRSPPSAVSPAGTCQRHSRSTAPSNSPTVVPSAPEMRCSSSWMIRSGGRSWITGWLLTGDRRPERLCRSRQPVRSSRSGWR